MKRLLNTLYITTQESYLAKDGECIAVHHGGSLKGKIPIHTLSGLVLLGQVTCSPYLLAHCAENGVAVSWLTEHGRFLATMHGHVSGNVLLRREQYRKADCLTASAVLARSMVIGKIANCRTILMRTARDRPHPALFEFQINNARIRMRSQRKLATGAIGPVGARGLCPR